MAATWIKSLHVKKSASKSSVVAAVIDYVEDKNKTDGGRLITSYHCDARVADDQFMLSKREYEHITGRSQGNHDVLAYHVRQSFSPGEVTPEVANEIGRQLALSFTKSCHSFVVATHIDRSHIHNHIIINSTTLDCTHKFNDFKRSGRAIRRISDLLCVEHGLSVIENPAPSKGSYGDWLGDRKKPTQKEDLRKIVDEVVPISATFDDFFARLRERGCIVGTKRKKTSVVAPGWKKPFRLETLGDGYTETAIRARLGKVKTITSGGDSGTRSAPNLLIDIQAKLREGKGSGYEQWAKIFNLKQAAKTLLFLQEQGIDSYDDLKKKTAATSVEFDRLSDRIKDADKKLKDISELQKQIGTYGKTRGVFDAYKRSGYDRAFYDANVADIILHRATKKFFDAHGFKGKLPSINSLRQEYATILTEKKKLYGDYHRLRDSSKELAVAKANADRLLGITENAQNREVQHTAHNRNSHDL
jgi:hypothetical protein